MEAHDKFCPANARYGFTVIDDICYCVYLKAARKNERELLRDKLCELPISEQRWVNCQQRRNPNCETCFALGLVF